MKMKPETIKRRAAARKKRVKAGRKNLEKRLSEKAKQEGPDSIWAEMLAELRSKNPMHKKKRSSKQLANDRRLGRMAKARAKAKRGGQSRVTRKKVARKKVARKNPHRRAASKGRIQTAIAKAKRTRSAKSHLWLIFACKGKIVQWMRLTTNAKYFFGGDKSKAIRFTTTSEALKIAKGLKGTRGWQVGVANDGTTAAQIAAQCKGGKV